MPMRPAFHALLAPLLLVAVTACVHDVPRRLSYVTNQPSHQTVRVRTVDGSTYRFETVYLVGDSIGGPLVGAPREVVKVHVDDIETITTREFHWGRVLMIGIASFTAMVYIGLRGS